MKGASIKKIIVVQRSKYLGKGTTNDSYCEVREMSKQSGFTLIELMLVIIIIGALAAMIMPSFVGRSEQARVTAAQADIEANLAIALDLYELDNGSYPTTEQGITALWMKPATPPIPQNWNGPYVKKPVVNDAWGNSYVYTCPGIHNTETYDLMSCGKDGVEGGGDDITNWRSETE